MVSIPEKKDLANCLAKGKTNSGFNPIVEAEDSVGQGFAQRYNGRNYGNYSVWLLKISKRDNNRMSSNTLNMIMGILLGKKKGFT